MDNTKNIVGDDWMRGVHFKVYGYEIPPSSTIVRDSVDGNLTFKGFAVDFVNYFADHYQLSLEFVVENASEIAKNGQIATAIQAVAKKEVDLSTFPFGTASIQLWPIMDFTSLVIQEPYELLVMWPKEESRLTAVIRPFNLWTWILIFVSSLVFAGFMAVILPSLYGYWKKDDNQGDEGVEIENQSSRNQHSPSPLKSIGKASMYAFAIFTQHAADANFIGINMARRFSLRLMLGLWLLMTAILSNLYLSTITSYMTVVKLKPIPNSLEELISHYEQDMQSKECLLTIQKGHPLIPKFHNANQTTFGKIEKWITQNPKFLVNALNEVSTNIVNHNCAQIGIYPAHAAIISKYYKFNGKCGMTISKPLKELEFFSLSFQLQKDSPYTEIVNKYVLRAISTGLIDIWRKWSLPNIDKCKLNKNKDGGKKGKPIKMMELSSAFLVLGAGIFLSTFAFLIECLMASRFFSK